MAKSNCSISSADTHLFQGALIDSDGNKIPITETMIQHACKVLEPAAESLYAEIPGSTAHYHCSASRR